MTGENAANISQLGCREETYGANDRGGVSFTPEHRVESGEKACGQAVTSTLDIPSLLLIAINPALSTVTLTYPWDGWMADRRHCHLLCLILKTRVEPSWEHRQEQLTP